MARISTGISVRRLVAGVDEAGRGPLAGPVAAAAVILADEAPEARPLILERLV